MTSIERKAALIVAGATVAVVVSGVRLLKKHAIYLAEKAAATFGTDEEEKDDQTA